MRYNIPFTQYIRPHGRKEEMLFETDSENVYNKSKVIREAGFHFEAEVLTTGEVSATIGDDNGDYAYSITANGLAAATGIEKMVTEFDIEKAKKQSEKAA